MEQKSKKINKKKVPANKKNLKLTGPSTISADFQSPSSPIPGPSGIQKYFTPTPNHFNSSHLNKNLDALPRVKRSISSICSSSNSSVITIIPSSNLLSTNLSTKRKIFLAVDSVNFLEKTIQREIPVSLLQKYSNLNEILQTTHRNTIKANELPDFVYDYVRNQSERSHCENLKFSPYIWLTSHDRQCLKSRNISNCIVKLNDDNFLHEFTALYIEKANEEKKKLFKSDKKILRDGFNKAFHFELQKRGSIENIMDKFYRRKKKLISKETKLYNKRKVIIGPKFFMEKRNEKLLEPVKKKHVVLEKSNLVDFASNRANGNQETERAKENESDNQESNRARVIESIILKDVVMFPNIVHENKDLNQRVDEPIVEAEDQIMSASSRKMFDYFEKNFPDKFIFESDFYNINKLYAEELDWRRNYNIYYKKFMDGLSKSNLEEDTSSIDWTMNLREFQNNTNVKLFITNIYPRSLQENPYIVKRLIQEFYEKIYLKEKWYVGLEIKSPNNNSTISKTNEFDQIVEGNARLNDLSINKIDDPLNLNVITNSEGHESQENEYNSLNSSRGEVDQLEKALPQNIYNDSKILFDKVSSNPVGENSMNNANNPSNELLIDQETLIASGDSLVRLLEDDSATIACQNQQILAKKIMEHALSSDHNSKSNKTSEILIITPQNKKDSNENRKKPCKNIETGKVLNSTEQSNEQPALENIQTETCFLENQCFNESKSENNTNRIKIIAGTQNSVGSSFDEIEFELSVLHGEILSIQSSSNLLDNKLNISISAPYAEQHFKQIDPLEVSSNDNELNCSNSEKNLMSFSRSQNLGVPLAQSTQSHGTNIKVLSKDLIEKEIKKEMINIGNRSYNSDEVQYIPNEPALILEISDEEEDIDVLLNEIGGFSGEKGQSLELVPDCVLSLDKASQNQTKSNNTETINTPENVNGSNNIETSNTSENVNEAYSIEIFNTPENVNKAINSEPPVILDHNMKCLDSRNDNIRSRRPNKQILIPSNGYSEFAMQARHNFNPLNLVSSTKGLIMQNNSGPKVLKKAARQIQDESEFRIEDASQVCIEPPILGTENDINTCNNLTQPPNLSSKQPIAHKLTISEISSEKSSKESSIEIEDFSGCNQVNIDIIDSPQNKAANKTFPVEVEINSVNLETVSQLLNTDNTYFDYNFSQFDEKLGNKSFEKTRENFAKSPVNVESCKNIELFGGFKRKFSEIDDYDFNENCQPVLKRIKLFSNLANEATSVSFPGKLESSKLSTPIPLNPFKFITNLNLVEINLNKDFSSLEYSSKTSFFNHFPNDLMQATISLGSKNFLHITGKDSLRFLLNLKSNVWNDIMILLNETRTFQYKRKQRLSVDYLPYKILHCFFETLPRFSQITYRKVDTHEDYIECVHVFPPTIKKKLLNALDSNILKNIETFKNNLKRNQI